MTSPTDTQVWRHSLDGNYLEGDFLCLSWRKSWICLHWLVWNVVVVVVVYVFRMNTWPRNEPQANRIDGEQDGRASPLLLLPTSHNFRKSHSGEWVTGSTATTTSAKRNLNLLRNRKDWVSFTKVISAFENNAVALVSGLIDVRSFK